MLIGLWSRLCRLASVSIVSVVVVSIISIVPIAPSVVVAISAVVAAVVVAAVVAVATFTFLVLIVEAGKVVEFHHVVVSNIFGNSLHEFGATKLLWDLALLVEFLYFAGMFGIDSDDVLWSVLFRGVPHDVLEDVVFEEIESAFACLERNCRWRE